MVAAVLLGAEQLHACAQQRGGVVHFQLAAVPLLLGEQRLALAVVDRVVAGEVVAPHLAGHAAERRGGQHVDLADVRIGGSALSYVTMRSTSSSLVFSTVPAETFSTDT